MACVRRNEKILCESLGLEVARLKRTSMGSLKLGMLPVGKWRHLEPKEVKALLMAAQVQKKIAAGYIKHGREGQAHADHRSGR